jgi:hypothetical protein
MAEVIHRSLEYPGYWRIAWFGRLTEIPKPGVPDLRIHVYLGQIQNSGTHLTRGELPKQLRVAHLPIGEIPRLYLNAVLHDGKLISDKLPKLSCEEKKTLFLNTNRKNVEVFDRFATHQNKLIIPRSNYADPMDLNKNALFVGFGNDDDPYAVVVPAIEVFRFFYATSDVLSKALLSDRFLDPDANLWSASNTAIDEQGRAVIWLRRRMLDADARFLARFAFDEYALRQAQNIFLYAAAWGGGSSTERMIRAIPPFQGTHKFTALCRPIGDNPRRTLITRFLSCDWAPPFNDLKWDRDNDGREDRENREDRPTAGYEPSLSALPPNNGAIDALSTSAPSGYNIPSRLREEEIRERFPNLGKVPAQKLPQTDTKTKSEPKNWKVFFKSAYEGSVVEGQSSFGMVGKTIIESMEIKNKKLRSATTDIDTSVCEEEYVNILELLMAIQANKYADIEFLTVLESYNVVRNVEFNVYPPEIDDRQKAWLYIDSGKTIRRMALLAKVANNTSTRYVLELQQRKIGECSTLVFWTQGEKPLPLGILNLLVMDCAKANGATLRSASSLGVCWGRLHHTTKYESQLDAQHFLQRIYSVRNISETP